MTLRSTIFIPAGILISMLVPPFLPATPDIPSPEPVEKKEDIRYKIQWNGIHKHPQEDAIREASRVESMKDVPLPSLPLLRRRMEDDVVRLEALLQANAYYLAKVEARFDNATVPPTIRFNCDPGPLFTIGNQTFTYVGAHAPVSPWKTFLNEEDAASTRVIEKTEEWMLRHFKNNGHPFPVIVEKSYVVDPERHQMDISYQIDPGQPMRMGRVEVTGLTAVSEKSILRQVNWQENALYDLRILEEFEKDLILTGLFSRVTLTPVPSEAEDDIINFNLKVTERHFRTVRFGVNYRSDVGAGAKASWEHRNIFGRGERLKVDLTVAEEENILSSWIRKPGYKIRNQSLIFGVTAAEERPDAYTSQSFETFVGLERTYHRKFANSVGLAYKYSNVRQAGDDAIYGLLSLPIETNWNTTRDDLHPVKGHRLVTEVTPYADLLNQDLTFGRLQVVGSKYYLLKKRPQLVLAGRATIGSLVGAETMDIPADERFYTGGGGSVRGYSYQSIGPKVDGQSVGGNSLLELSIELRTRFTETWGLATFLDGGMVTDEESPFGNQPLQWGAGLGLRIFTGIGPLRVDFAYPINPNEDQESQLQFYISLGQSF